jgi:hypothetical protein
VGPDHSPRGKTSDGTRVIRGRFLELIPAERMVQPTEFESEDPAFAGAMTITWTPADDPGGTEVIILCENAPEDIEPSDHGAGFRSTPENLAAFTE